jgi:hypothetical protein
MELNVEKNSISYILSISTNPKRKELYEPFFESVKEKKEHKQRKENQKIGIKSFMKVKNPSLDSHQNSKKNRFFLDSRSKKRIFLKIKNGKPKQKKEWCIEQPISRRKKNLLIIIKKSSNFCSFQKRKIRFN